MTTLDSDHAECKGLSNTITQLRFLVFCISVTSLLGQWGHICFPEFLKIISSFFAQNFCTDRVDILLCSERNKNGGKCRNLAPLAPSKYCGRRRQARARLRPRRVCSESILDTWPGSSKTPVTEFVCACVRVTVDLLTSGHGVADF